VNAREIIRRGDRRHARVGPVNQAGFDNQLYSDVGILRGQPLERRPKDRPRSVLTRVDADRVGWLLAEFAERGKPGVDVIEGRVAAPQPSASAQINSIGYVLFSALPGRRAGRRLEVYLRPLRAI
jgi:hypothetical protein